MRGQNKKTLILVALLVSITFFLFGPVEYYMTNINEIWFSLNSIIGLLFSVALISTAAIYLVLFILPDKLQKVFACLVFSIGLGLYLQGNFLNVSYGLLNGQDIEWDNYVKYGLMNTIIWVVIIMTPLLLVKIIGREKIFKAMKIVSLFIIAIQVVTMATLFLTTSELKDKNRADYVGVTTKDLFTFSENQNVLIYILDTFDAKYLNQLIQEDSELMDTLLADFTYYPDTLGAFPTTKGALPQILTGKWYDNTTPYSEYIKEAWNNSTIYPDLTAENFDVGIYTNNLYISPQQSKILMNWPSEKERSDTNKINNVGGLIRLYYKMVAFKYLPHYMKKPFVTYTGDLDVFINDEIYSESNDFAFYNKLAEDGIKLQKNKIFKIVHLYGAHPPYTMDSNMQRVQESTVGEQGIGILKILNNLFGQLKQKGVYDNSTIIILADHGDPNFWAQNPIFMIKDQNDSGKFKISDVPVSYEDLPEIYASAISGVSVNNYISTSYLVDRTRKFCYYDWFAEGDWDKDNLPPITEYVIGGKSVDFPDSHIEKKSIYDSEGKLVTPYYKIGNKITFGENKEDESYFDKYALYGFSYTEGKSRWSSGYESCLDIPLENFSVNDLKLQINFSDILGKKQRLKVYANDVLIGDETGTKMTLEYNIPANIIKNSHLKLIFQYPNATTPKSIGIGEDQRTLAYRFESIILH